MVALRAGVFAGAIGFCSGQGGNTDGNPQCPCLGVAAPDAPWSQVSRSGGGKECVWTELDWLNADDAPEDDSANDVTMTCMLANVPTGTTSWTLYPQSYGARCQNHKEVGSSSCYYMNIVDGSDQGGVQVIWDANTATSDILSEIDPPTALGRFVLTVGTEMEGQDLADFEGRTLEGLCAAGDTCTIGDATETTDCTDEVDGCDLQRYNSQEADEALKLAPSWCGNNYFCYVNPCECTDRVTRSDYFPEALSYSYATCGAPDDYADQEGRDRASATEGCGTGNGDTSSSVATMHATCGVATVAALMMIAMK